MSTVPSLASSVPAATTRAGERPGTNALCVVQERFMPLAQKRLAEQTEEYPDLDGRVELVTGDITRAGIGYGSGH